MYVYNFIYICNDLKTQTHARRASEIPGLYATQHAFPAPRTVSENDVWHTGWQWKKAICVAAKCGVLMDCCAVRAREIPIFSTGTIKLEGRLRQIFCQSTDSSHFVPSYEVICSQAT